MKTSPITSPRTLLSFAFAAALAAGAWPAFAQDDAAASPVPATAVTAAGGDDAAATIVDASASPASIEAAPVMDAPLRPGRYEWTPDATASGPVTVLVSLPAQMVHVYRGSVRIGRSTISSGREGYETPPGVYEILEKDRVHHSNKYDNAPMPFMQRLTWDGVALHAGHIPGYPASHGCVRLPLAFAEQLFSITEKGSRVIVADASTYSSAVLYPGARAPVDPWTGLEPSVATAPVGAADADVAMGGAPTATASMTIAASPDPMNAPVAAPPVAAGY